MSREIESCDNCGVTTKNGPLRLCDGCNAPHDELLAELTALLNAVEGGHADAGPTNRCPLCVAVKSARAALAKAGAK